MPIPIVVPAAMSMENGLTFLDLRCESTSIPIKTIKTEKVKIRGSIVERIVDSDTFGNIDLIFLENPEYFVSKFFDFWRLLIINNSTKEISPNYTTVIPRGVFLRLLNGIGIDMDIFELHGVYPNTCNLGRLTNEAGVQRVSVNLHYNNFERLFV
jgi:hypothetical protein